jgi:glycosyltransferase involved in cell wall biosynthesis
MRIALYFNLPNGGAKRAIYETMRRISEKHHVDSYSLSSSNHEFADLRPLVANYYIYPFKSSPLFRSPFGRLNQVSRSIDLLRLRLLNQKIARDIQHNKYDLLLAHPCQYEKCPSVLRYIRQMPSAYYCHEPLRAIYEETPLRPYEITSQQRKQILDRYDPFPRMYLRLLKETDRHNIHSVGTVFVNSRFTGEGVKRYYGVDSQISYPGVDGIQFHPAGLEKQHMVLSVGSLTPLKGFDFLIRVMNEIPKNERPLLLLASNFQNPPELAYLSALADSLDVRVNFLGNVTDASLVELYNQAKITLYAPVREPLGLVPLESMACCTPVVAVREGGIQETILHGETGYLVDRDEASFASEVQRLLSDPALATRLGQNGREYVMKRWNWDQAVDDLEHQLSALVRS